jgi:hypothetical protein
MRPILLGSPASSRTSIGEKYFCALAGGWPSGVSILWLTRTSMSWSPQFRKAAACLDDSLAGRRRRFRRSRTWTDTRKASCESAPIRFSDDGTKSFIGAFIPEIKPVRILGIRSSTPEQKTGAQVNKWWIRLAIAGQQRRDWL